MGVQKHTQHSVSTILFLYFVFLFFPSWLGTLFVDAGACPCTTDPDISCPVGCSTCNTSPVSCTCNSGCTQSGCAANGDYSVSNPSRSWCFCWCGLNQYDNTCVYSRNRGIGTCVGCKTNYYGSTCQPCPGQTTGNPCNVVGSGGRCLDGISGSGVCQCNNGFFGNMCQYSNSGTCNGHGTTDASGQCVCNVGYRPGKNTEPTAPAAGSSQCGSCTTNYYPYGTSCIYCYAQSDCGSLGVAHGNCGTDGRCICNAGFVPTNTYPAFGNQGCTTCDYASGVYYGTYPSCKYCLASNTCNNHGTCDSATGNCNCFTPNFIQSAACLVCSAGYYGASCAQCPGPVGNPCNGRGTCSDGASGNGLCTCNTPYFGNECNNPVITGVSPLNGPTDGVTITIDGLLFSTAGQINIRCANYPGSCPGSGIQFPASVSWQPNRIVVNTPPFNGTYFFYVTVSGLQSNYNYLFKTDPPKITGISPFSGPTTGYTTTITGTSLGSTLVTPNSAGKLYLLSATNVPIAASQILSWTHQQIIFNIPPGTGTGYIVILRNWTPAQTEQTATFGYDAPILLSVTSVLNLPVPTSGGTLLTVHGSNFAGFSTYIPGLPPTVTVGPLGCTLVNYTNTDILCYAPEGRGLLQVVLVQVKTQSGSAPIVNYAAPSITNVQPVTGSCTQSGAGVISCNPQGGDLVQVNGNNFAADLSKPVQILINNRPCTGVVMAIAHVQLLCQYTPSGYGINTTIAVSRDSQIGSTYMFGYASAQITSRTLARFGFAPVPSGAGTVVNAASTNGGDIITFQGNYFGTVQSQVMVTYGDISNPSTYVCNVLFANNTYIKCQTSPGVGGPLYFVVTVLGAPSDPSIDAFYYPAPTFESGSLALSGQFPPIVPPLYGKSNNGDGIQFRGHNFGSLNGTFIVVTLVNTLPAIQCAVDTKTANDTFIICQTAKGFVQFLQLVVCVGPGPNSMQCTAPSVPDMYNYPVPPRIDRISGCSIDSTNGNATADCPTDTIHNPVTITLEGDDFGDSGAGVTVGNGVCFPVAHDPITPQRKLRCSLPSGVGLQVSVVVNQGVFFSIGTPLVSYAIPVVYSVFGCQPVFNDTTQVVNCARPGGDILTVTGDSFGASRARVLIGGSDCEGVVHGNGTLQHKQLTCFLPAGVSIDKPVLVIQDQGEISGAGSNNVQVSYTQCEAGEFGFDVNCTLCIPGQFSNVEGQPVCLDCPSGTFSGSFGASKCDKCGVGTFSGTTGLSACIECGPGSYTAETGQQACSQCPAGTSSDQNATTSCVACSFGSYSDSPGATECLPCPRGSATFVQGSLSCAQCQPGFAQNLTGQVSCVSCPPGQISSLGAAKGSFECLDCGPGTFTNNYAQSSCTSCSAGRANSLPAQSVCSSCETGKFSNTTALVNCRDCEKGKYTSAQGASACQDCGTGTYIDIDGQSACLPCPTGRFQNSSGMTFCFACDIGRYSSLPGQGGCIACEAGSYANTTAMPTCLSCPPGTFSIGSIPGSGNPGSTSCDLCAPGKFSNFPGFAACADCAVGSASGGYGAESCAPCSPGTYSQSTGSTNCSLCDPGTVASGVSSTSCDACTTGKYAPHTNSSTCIKCEQGRYQPGFGASTCIGCPNGTSSYFDGSTECQQCPSGRFSNSTGQPTCYDCPQGTYSLQMFGDGATSCTPCPLGKYGLGTNRANCDDCDPGNYQNVTGQSACLPCLRGTFTSDHGTVNCELCQPGRYNPVDPQPGSTGQRQCQLCLPGQHQPNNGSDECLNCLAGSFQLMSGQALCDPCPPGTYNSGQGRPQCTPCAAGTAYNMTGLQVECPACNPGTFQSNTGESTCQLCTPGRYNLGYKQSQCRGCDAGTATNFTGQTACQPCSEGYFTSTTGNIECSPCAVGRYQDQTTGQTACKLCDLGTYAANIGQPRCDACPPGRWQDLPEQSTCKDARPGYYANDAVGAVKQEPCSLDVNDPKKTQVAPYAGMSVCVSCDLHGTASQEQDGCICDAGYFSANIQSQHDIQVLHEWFDLAPDFNTTQACIPCPLGADCGNNGVTQDTLSSLVGWWRASTDIYLFHRCLFTWHCDGADRRNSSCGNYRTGVICAVCLPGYRSATGYSKCEACGSYASSVGVSIVIIAVVIFALLLMYYIVLRNDRPLMLAAQERDRKVVEWEVEDKDDGLSNAPVLSMESRSRPNLTYKLKIIVGFLQIMTNLVFIVQIPWPSYFSQFISVFDFLNLNFVPWQSLGCATEFTYYTKWLVITITPLCIMVALFLFFLLPMYVLDRRDMSDDELYRAARKRTRKKFWKLALFTLFLLYPGVSSTVLSMMICKDIDGTYYLLRDFSVECWDSQWFSFLPATVIMTLLYPIGVPLFLLYLLRQYRPHMLEPDIRVQLGFLYEAYNTDMWYFELCDLTHKLSLTAIVGFFDVYAQMPLALCISTCYSMLILARSPYVRRSDDQLHLFVQIEIYLIIDAGMILFNQNTQSLDDATDVLLSALLIFLCCCLFLLFCVMFAFSLRKLWRLRVRNKVLEAQRKALIASGQEPDETLPIENAMGDRLLRRSHSKSELQRSRTMSKNPAYDPNASPPHSPKAGAGDTSPTSGHRVGLTTAHTPGSPRQQKMQALLADETDNFNLEAQSHPQPLQVQPSLNMLTPDVIASLNPTPIVSQPQQAASDIQISGPIQNNLFSNYMIPTVVSNSSSSSSSSSPSSTEQRRKTANSSAAPPTGPRIVEPSPRKSLQATQPSASPARVGLMTSAAPAPLSVEDDPLQLGQQINRPIRGPTRLAHAQPQSQTGDNAAANSSGVDWD